MITRLQDFSRPYFIGVAGSGMSAVAQYLKGIGMQVAGSDRQFNAGCGQAVRSQLEKEGIRCFPQDGSGIDNTIDLVVVSTAIESSVSEVKIAQERGIPIIHRASLLAIIAASKKTIAVAGTSGKSTTAAMLFDILEQAGFAPSIISGAGLTRIIQQGKLGNAVVGKGVWLVIEADESDGSIVQYHPEIGLLLNIDKDHDEVDTLLGLFKQFCSQSKHFVINQTNPLAATLSVDRAKDFKVEQACAETSDVGYIAKGFSQKGLQIQFEINGEQFELEQVGKHSMENALAAAAVAHQIGISLATAALALKKYQGIYRRHQILGQKNGVWVIDDYAHNPAKCAAAITACQPIASKVVAWFQPHGYKPTRFLRHDFVQAIAASLRAKDEIWMSEIYYAGGTAVKDISAADLVADLKALGVEANFVEDRNSFLSAVRASLQPDCVLLLMGARDPSLEQFAKELFSQL
ncbi:MAG: UDP-N-acetylmuramate--alanine ligase [Bacteroidetes bacterium]|nr:UDP-N-acetylmuramate--alanine ligase [Bacteroidota bacterium]